MANYCLECSRQGLDCCREAHAKFVTLKDAKRIAEYLKADINTFALYGDLKKEDHEEHIYVSRRHNYYYDLTRDDGKLLQLKNKSDGSCFFQDSTGSCRIYPVRLLICRTYPFWYSDRDEVIFDPCSSDCRIVCALTGNDDPNDVSKLEDSTGSQRSCALDYVGESQSSIQHLLSQMKEEIEDYRMNLFHFINENNIPII